VRLDAGLEDTVGAEHLGDDVADDADSVSAAGATVQGQVVDDVQCVTGHAMPPWA
jgi:hypothetical protein